MSLQAGRKLSEEKVLFAIDHLALTEAQEKLNSVERSTESVEVVKKGLGEISEFKWLRSAMPLRHFFRFKNSELLNTARAAFDLGSTAAIRLLAKRVPLDQAFKQALGYCQARLVRQLLELGADPLDPEVATFLCKNPRSAQKDREEIQKMLEEAQKPKQSTIKRAFWNIINIFRG